MSSVPGIFKCTKCRCTFLQKPSNNERTALLHICWNLKFGIGSLICYADFTANIITIYNSILDSWTVSKTTIRYENGLVEQFFVST